METNSRKSLRLRHIYHTGPIAAMHIRHICASFVYTIYMVQIVCATHNDCWS